MFYSPNPLGTGESRQKRKNKEFIVYFSFWIPDQVRDDNKLKNIIFYFGSGILKKYFLFLRTMMVKKNLL